jgi:hypothetical protein
MSILILVASIRVAVRATYVWELFTSNNAAGIKLTQASVRSKESSNASKACEIAARIHCERSVRVALTRSATAKGAYRRTWRRHIGRLTAVANIWIAVRATYAWELNLRNKQACIAFIQTAIAHDEFDASSTSGISCLVRHLSFPDRMRARKAPTMHWLRHICHRGN